jgi:hypothetical protein
MESGVSELFLIRYTRGKQIGLALDEGDKVYALDDTRLMLDAPLAGLPADQLLKVLAESKRTPIDLTDP